MQLGLSVAAIFVLSLANPAAAQDRIHRNGFESEGFTFFEPFTWSGNHASTIDASNSMGGGHHHGNTVWWNEDDWDARGDTGFLATALPTFDPPIGVVKGYHIDVHKSLTADPRDGREDNNVHVIGGDGSPGVAAMRLDYQGVSDARLRNPLLVREGEPGIVEWYAPKFVTTAHWWEIAFTPTATVIGGENTAIPSQVSRPPFEDSLNFVAIGHDDVPCLTGWRATFDVHRSIGGVETVETMQRPDISDFPAIDPNRKMDLTAWRLELRPSGVDLFADLDENGSLEHVQHYNTGVPWPEVHVHLLGIAYQADHHPQGECYQGINRELVWRDIRVRPVKYRRTSYAPRNTLLENVQRSTDWLGYDTRDIQRFGAAVMGVAQANGWQYHPYGDMAFTSVGLYAPNAKPSAPNKTLTVQLDASQASATTAQLVYDIKGRGDAVLTVNNQVVGAIPNMRSVRYFANSGPNDNLLFEWTRRSVPIPMASLHAGANQIRIDMTGEVVMDRLQLEFAHAE